MTTALENLTRQEIIELVASGLRDEIRQMILEELGKLKPAIINVTVPTQPAPAINVHVPEAKPPIVNVAPTQVKVEVPKQPAPNIIVNPTPVTVTPAPIPAPPPAKRRNFRVSHERGKDGKIASSSISEI